MKAGKEEKKQVELVNAWNIDHHPGIDVRVMKDDNTSVRTKTISEAYMLGACRDYPGHTAVILLEGMNGCYRLDRIKPVTATYTPFLKKMKRSHVHEGRKEIRETDTDFINTSKIKKGSSGKVMELHCPEQTGSISGVNFTILPLAGSLPESRAVSICGQSQANGTDPYFFSLRCFDESGREPSPNTRFNIKTTIAGGENPLWKVSYGSLSQYHFKDGIFLSNGDRLELEVIDSDIDIDRVEVSTELDVFRAEG